jgi:23S rRNA pseudouridine2605 synthase
MRLAKYLAHAGVASRRAAETLIAAGRVSVGGGRHRPGPRRRRAQPRGVDGRPLEGPEPRVVYALNKPVGVVSTARDTHGRPTVVELVPARACGCTRSGGWTPTRAA